MEDLQKGKMLQVCLVARKYFMHKIRTSGYNTTGLMWENILYKDGHI